MDQQQNSPEQRTNVRRRYTAAPAPQAPAPDEASTTAASTAETQMPTPAQQPAPRRRADKRRTDAEESIQPAESSSVFPEAPVQAAMQDTVPLMPESKLAAKPAWAAAPNPLSAYDKRNTAAHYTERDKHREGVQHRFSDKHLISEDAARTHKKSAISGHEKKEDRPAEEKTARGEKTKEKTPARKPEEATEQKPIILTASDYDRRLSGKGQLQRAGDTRPGNNGKAAKHTGQPRKVADDAAPQGQEKPPLKKRLPYYIGIAVCTVVLIVSGTMLLRYYSQIWRADQASGQLRDLYKPGETAEAVADLTAAPEAVAAVEADNDAAPSLPEEAENTEQSADVSAAAPAVAQKAKDGSTDAFQAAWPKKYIGNEQMLIQERFTPLRHQNKDIVGWLSIEGVVDEPVFQRDNSYYLTHDATGTKNPTGALFLDEKCNLRTVPMMTLIHGHNMKEGAMFGSLKKYKVKDASFYRQHPFITFDSLYDTATYVIFSVAEVNIVPGNTHYFPFWHRFSFPDESSFDQFVSLAKEYSRFKVDIDVEPGDRLLTLATCSSEDSNLRLIVMARMLRENEDTIMLTNKIYSAVAK